MRRTALCAIVVGLSLAGCSQGFPEQVDALFSPYKNAPGAAVLVLKDGKALVQKGYGYADVESKRPITPTTVFDLASCSKQFTAMAVLILAQRGKLSLNDPLSKFFPRFPAYSRSITVRHLLTHTGGLPDYMEAFVEQKKIAGDWPKAKKGPNDQFEPVNLDVVNILAAQPKPLFPSGTKWEYSNSGYAVLGAIVEKASGQRFADFLRQNIFKPLEMRNTQVLDERTRTAKNRAISYMKKGDAYVPIDYTPLNLIVGDGNVNTTIEDMAKWDAALYTTKLIPKKVMEEAYSPAKLTDGTTKPYGYGWMIGTQLGRKVAEHGGGWVGFRTHILRFPSEHFTVIVLSNNASMNTGLLAQQIAGRLLRE